MIQSLLLQAANLNTLSGTDSNVMANFFDSVISSSLVVLLFVFLIFLALSLQFISYYHLAVNDSIYFKDGIYEKKKWFWLFFLSAFSSFFFIGVILVPAFSLYYILVIKSEVERKKLSQNTPPMQINSIGEDHEVNL